MLTPSSLASMFAFCLQFQTKLKLFHLRTTSYAAHKASDEMHEKWLVFVDKFFEAAQGRIRQKIARANITFTDTASRMTSTVERTRKGLLKMKTTTLVDYPELSNLVDEIVLELDRFAYFLELS